MVVKLLFSSKQSGSFGESTVRYNGFNFLSATVGNTLTFVKYLIQTHVKTKTYPFNAVCVYVVMCVSECFVTQYTGTRDGNVYLLLAEFISYFIKT